MGRDIGLYFYRTFLEKSDGEGLTGARNAVECGYMKAVKRIINSVWTLEYNLVALGEIEILHFSRDDEEGYRNEYTLPKGDVIENAERIVTGAVISGIDYKVINQKHIFSYGDSRKDSWQKN